MLNKLYYLNILFLFFPYIYIFGQNQIRDTSFSPLYPLEIPMAVSGCFGDLRTNALHAGYDFKTNGKTGFKVYSVEKGYISRIKIEPGGYGRAVYITHPNGWVSVYAHLEKLNSTLDQYVKGEQYKKESFAVDLFPARDSLNILRGEVIGFSGNAGMSTGPHLHFEIRDEKTQEPVNISRYFNFPVTDTLAPRMDKLWIYNKINLKTNYTDLFARCETNLLPVNKSKNNRINDTLRVNEQFYLGLELNEPTTSIMNKTGIYTIEVYYDSVKYFNLTVDRFAFSDVRYVNSIIDYEYFQLCGKRITKLYRQPNNLLPFYRNLINNGVVELKDTLSHTIKVSVSDGNLNTSTFSFIVLKNRNELSLTQEDSTVFEKKLIKCKIEQNYSNKWLQLNFSPNSVYENFYFNFISDTTVSNFYSPIVYLHNSNTPIHAPVLLKIKTQNLPQILESKAIITVLNNQNLPVWGGGNYKNGVVEMNIRSFGKYAVTIDTVPPVIKPNFKIRKIFNFSSVDTLSFKISDNLSGIKDYIGKIDGNWVLFEYDAKSETISYIFDNTRTQFQQNHHLQLIVNDVKGNCSEFSMDFYK